MADNTGQMPTQPAILQGQTPKIVDSPSQNPQAQTNTQTSSNTTATYAGFWIRFVALIIDIVILNTVGGAILFIFSFSGNTLLQPGSESVPDIGFFAGIFGVLNLVIMAINIIYFVALTGIYGATLGKMVLGLRVVDTSGQKIGFGKAALREIVGKWVSSLVFGLGYLWVAFDDRKQGWHDKIASTFVVKTR